MPAPLNAEQIREDLARAIDAIDAAEQARHDLRRTSRRGDPARDERLTAALATMRDRMHRVRSVTGSIGQGVPLPSSLGLTPDEILAVSKRADKERRRIVRMLR